MGGPTTWAQATGVPPMQPPQAMIRLGDEPGPVATAGRPWGPVSPGGAILAERQRLEAEVAELAVMAEGALRDVATLRAALTDLLALSQVQVLLTPDREAILHRAERALADTAPPASA